MLTMGSDPMYDLQTFDLPNVDFVALGHIHKHQALSYASPQVVYAGSIDRVDFGEQNEEKGWVFIELADKGKADWDFRKVKARPFLTIDAVVESDNATEDVVRAIAREADHLREAVVRVRIDVPPERAGELREDDIRAQLKGAYYVAPLERVARQRPRSRWGAAGTALQRAGPLEALALYLEHQKVEVPRRETLLRYARGLMDEGSGAADWGLGDGPISVAGPDVVADEVAAPRERRVVGENVFPPDPQSPIPNPQRPP
jgi:exonuclease SbcD